jgi:hypothetical protein
MNPGFRIAPDDILVLIEMLGVHVTHEVAAKESRLIIQKHRGRVIVHP